MPDAAKKMADGPCDNWCGLNLWPIASIVQSLQTAFIPDFLVPQAWSFGAFHGTNIEGGQGLKAHWSQVWRTHAHVGFFKILRIGSWQENKMLLQIFHDHKQYWESMIIIRIMMICWHSFCKNHCHFWHRYHLSLRSELYENSGSPVDLWQKLFGMIHVCWGRSTPIISILRRGLSLINPIFIGVYVADCKDSLWIKVGSDRPWHFKRPKVFLFGKGCEGSPTLCTYVFYL